jgi:hypothetical protein
LQHVVQTIGLKDLEEHEKETIIDRSTFANMYPFAKIRSGELNSSSITSEGKKEAMISASQNVLQSL